MTKNDKVNVLLVDDRPENLLVLRATLSSPGINLVEAQSGKEALKYLLEKDFAVILLDVMMPEMDGFETARLIREREKSKYTPIIFVTAMFLDDQDAFRGYSVGAVDYIMKPFAPAILRSKISVFVDLFRKTQELKRQAEHIRAIEQREFITKLQAAEEKMWQETERERSEARAARAVLELAPVGFARLDKDQRILETNRVFVQQFSLHDEVHNKLISAVLPGLPQSVLDAIANRQAFLVHDLNVVKDDGSASGRYCDLAVWPTKNTYGQLSSTILVSTDVTERILRDAQRKDFVATLAHDLQTPVIASDRALSLLLTNLPESLSSDMTNLVTMLKKNNQNLLHMIEALMDVYYYEEGAGALYFDAVDLKLVADTCIEELLPLASEQGLSIKSKFSANLGPVLADRTAIRRVITNLLDNAIKFTPRGGTITIQAKNEDTNAVITVSDTGIGIKPEDEAHLFERYWHGIGHKTYKGSRGLGLFLCRQIVESHSGQITCASTPDKGTTFTFTLPISVKKTIAANETQPVQQSAV